MCHFQSIKKFFNMLKDLLHIVLVACIQLVELLFNQLISLKSSEINRLYEQINLLNSLMTKLYKLVFRDMSNNLRFLSAKNSDTNLENSHSVSGLHSVQLLIEDLDWSWKHFCFVEARRTRVRLARESLHQVWLFFCFYVVPSVKVGL